MKAIENIPGYRAELLGDPFVQSLLLLVQTQATNLDELSKKVEALEDEIRRLKKLPKRPRLKPSNLDKDQYDGKQTKKREGGGKRKRKETLEIHEHKEIALTGLPAGWKFVGHKSCLIQDMIVRANNIEYKLEI